MLKYRSFFEPVSLTRIAIIAALYAAITLLLAPISYGVVQLRLAEALTVLPILFPEAIPGLFLGVLIANIFGGLGLPDILGGSLVTLLAACVTYYFRRSIVAYLSPVLFNAFLISLYLHVIYEWPYWLTVISIGISQTIVVLGLGYPLVKKLGKWQERTY